MARKEPFEPIWNYDDAEEKKDRKKMTLKELDRERGKRGMEAERPAQAENGNGEKHYRGMFEEDRASHKMSKKKEKTIAIIVVIIALVFAVTALILRVKWQRERLARYMALPRGAWSVCCRADAPL